MPHYRFALLWRKNLNHAFGFCREVRIGINFRAWIILNPAFAVGVVEQGGDQAVEIP